MMNNNEATTTAKTWRPAVEPFLVRDLSLECFRFKLITHFDIAVTKCGRNRNQETGEEEVSL
jgi:hypothetical protein